MRDFMNLASLVNAPFSTGSAPARRGRDTQRQRAYAAEDSTETMRRNDIPTRSLEDCQAYVNDVLGRAWVRREFGRREVTVYAYPGGRGARAGRTYIKIETKSRNRMLLLHELAHCLAPSNVSHGREWARIYHRLVRRIMGSAEGKELKLAFRAHRVKHTKRTAATIANGQRLAAAAKARGGNMAGLERHHARQREERELLAAFGWREEGASGWWTNGYGMFTRREAVRRARVAAEAK